MTQQDESKQPESAETTPTRFVSVGEVRFAFRLPAGPLRSPTGIDRHGALIGVVSRDAIVHYLEVRRSLGVENPKSDAQNRLRHAA